LKDAGGDRKPARRGKLSGGALQIEREQEASENFFIREISRELVGG
jgi:hypothetical protein